MRTLRAAGLFVVVFLTLKLFSQGFNKRYDAFEQGNAQGSFGVELTEQGITVFSASFEPDTLGPDSIVGTYALILQGLNGLGELQWQKRYRRNQYGEFLGWADCCDSVIDGGFVVGGSSQQYWTGLDEARLVRFNTQGDSIWSRSFGSPGAFWLGQQAKHTSDGGFLICGNTDAVSYQDAFAIKTDGGGNEQWRHTYGVGGVVTEAFSAVVELSDGYLLTGRSRPQADDGDMYVVRVNMAGDEIWTQEWGGIYDDAQVHSYLCAEGSVLLAGGYGYADDGESTVPYLAKLDTADGSLIWEGEYGEPRFGTLFFAAKECPNTDFIACGVTYEGGHEQGLLLRATSEGDSLWMRNYSYYDEVIDSCRGRFWDVLPIEDGGFIMSGFANGPFGGPYPPGYSQDAWVVKVDSMGCVVPGCDATGVTEIITNLNDALTVYPNPAHGQVQVGITLPISLRNGQALQLTFVSASGQVVLVHAAQEGSNEVDIRALASGLYYVHLSNEKTWISGSKLIVE